MEVNADGLASFVFMGGESETDGIHTMPSSKEKHTDWYTLYGRRLATKPNTKGLYLVNGRKVIVP